MILPGTFAGPPYDVMSLLASEFAWGGIAIVLGASKMHFVFCKKSISLSVLNLISGYFWLIVGVSFLMSSPMNTGAPVYMMLGFYEFWLYKRLAVRRD